MDLQELPVVGSAMIWIDGWTASAGGGGRKFSAGGRVAVTRGEAGLLGALDLGHAAVVHDELDHPVTERLDLLAHKLHPVGLDCRGIGGKG